MFADEAAVIETFVAWLRRAPDGATAVINVGDPGGAAVATALSGSAIRIVTTMLVDEAGGHSGGPVKDLADRYATAAGPARPLVGRIVASEPTGTKLELHGLGSDESPLPTRLSSAGRHNAANALGVAGAAAALGVEPRVVVDALGSFAGVGRRLERKGEAAGVVVYDDYGHHPTAIRETLRPSASANPVAASGRSTNR